MEPKNPLKQFALEKFLILKKIPFHTTIIFIKNFKYFFLPSI